MTNEINESPTFEQQNAVFDELDKAFAFLSQKIGQGNEDPDKGLITFSMLVYTLSENQLISALHSFGGRSRRRIQVQLGSVARRKSKIGS